MPKKYAYYPGCSLHSTSFEYDRSFREVCSALGLEIEEIKGWNCCGASSAHAVSKRLASALPADIMKKARQQGLDEILVPCAACFSRLKTTEHEIKKEPAFLRDMQDILGASLDGDVRITHPLDLIEKLVGGGNALPAAQRRFPAKVACYYGCLLTRPPKITQFDDCEYPMSMDNILRKFGIETVDWSYKTECCGASLSLSKPEIVKKLVKKITDNAADSGAEAIAVACPLCHANLDTRQDGSGRGLPVFYFTQLLGLVLGIDAGKLAVKSHLVNTSGIVERMK